MSKILECSKVEPSSNCNYVIRGETEQELLKNAALHARQHGIQDFSPELMDRVKQNIREE